LQLGFGSVNHCNLSAAKEKGRDPEFPNLAPVGGLPKRVRTAARELLCEVWRWLTGHVRRFSLTGLRLRLSGLIPKVGCLNVDGECDVRFLAGLLLSRDLFPAWF
jgi:hypothetical protein